MRPLSLRARLVLGVVALAMAALLAGNAATYLSLRSFLLSRVDSSLEAGHAQVEQQTLGVRDGGPRFDQGHDADRDQRPPAEGIDWYEVRSLSGSVLRRGFLVGGGSAPRLPATIRPPTAVDRSADGDDDERVAYFTVPAQNDSTNYRVRASRDSEAPGRLLLVASSLRGVSGILHRLLLIELLVTLVALAAIVALAAWVIRLGLRPLRAIETTAATIAGGDLGDRVRRAEPRTEVGRLGLSLNTMLGQVESAFRARERSEARLRQFVADASHELRTPLAAVRAYAELFGRGADHRPDDLARSMTGISRETERMSRLVEELLQLAHLDEGRPPEREPLDLGRLAAEAVDTARVVEPERPIALQASPGPVLGDRVALRQVLDNLLANVRAHTPPGTPVRVSVTAGGEHVVLRVADRGPGLHPEQMTRVFERFYRIDPSRARASGGAGLGLAIVAAVAGAHGGAVSAEPTPGGGVTFLVTLPRRG